MQADVFRLDAGELAASLREPANEGLVGAFFVVAHQEPRFTARFVASNWPPELLDRAVHEDWLAVAPFARTNFANGNAVARYARRHAPWSIRLDAMVRAGLHPPVVARVVLREGSRVIIVLSPPAPWHAPALDKLKPRMPTLAAEALDSYRRGFGPDRLDDREVALLHTVAAGRTPEGPTSTATLFRPILAKLHARTIEHAIAIAMRRGLLR